MRASIFFIHRIPVKYPKFFANLLQNSTHWFSEQLLKIHCSSSLVFALSEILHKTDLDDTINELLIAKIKETVYILFLKNICHWPFFFCNTWLFFGWIFVIVNNVVLGFSEIKPSWFFSCLSDCFEGYLSSSNI